MQLKFMGEQRALVAKVEGELDHHVAKEVREVIDREIKRTSAVNIIFDFSDITFMDSSGIGVIVGRYKLAKTLGGTVILFGASNQVRRIVEMSGIHKIVKIASSFENALMLI